MDKLKVFAEAGENIPINYIETTAVKPGVVCDVYSFEGDNTRDLAVVTVIKEEKTPLQRVLRGDKTLEGFMSGEGTLHVTRVNGNKEDYIFPGTATNAVASYE